MANFKLTQTKEQIQADLDLLDKNTATAGQVLTANGTGGASWQNAAGATPNISVTATELPAGSSPTATRSGTNENPIITFGIPQGSENALVKPSTPPNVIELVGIDTSGNQVRIQVDTTEFVIDGSASPYTFKKKVEPQGFTIEIDKYFNQHEKWDAGKFSIGNDVYYIDPTTGYVTKNDVKINDGFGHGAITIDNVTEITMIEGYFKLVNGTATYDGNEMNLNTIYYIGNTNKLFIPSSNCRIEFELFYD